MRIAFVGRVSLNPLAESFRFDRVFPVVKWGFPLGSEIVKELVGKGHEVHVITEHTVDQEEVYRAEGLVVHLVPSRKRSRWTFLTLFFKEVQGLRDVIKKIKPDVVFAQWTYANAYAGLTSGYPTLCVAHDSPWRIAWVNGGLQAWVKANYAQLFVFPRLKNLTTVSPYITEELRRFNRYKRKVPVIPNGIKIPADYQRTPIRENATTVAVVADWSARKNVKTFFRAWSALKKRRPHWRAVVFGAGLDEETAGMWAAKRGIALDGIELRGLQSRPVIDKFLREEADVFCSPSLEESFGMVFVEAMIRGVPCVGGEKSGAVPWVMGEGGVTCDVTCPEKLAACLEDLMLDYERRKRLSDAGMRRVREMFDLEKIVDAYEAELMRVSGV